MSVRDLRIKMMKNHIWLVKVASQMNVAPVTVDGWLNNENLAEETIEAIDCALDEILKTWKYGEAMEKTKRGKLLKPHVVAKIKKQLEKEHE